MESYDILVIILSVSLAVSLVIWIVVGVYAVKILKSVRAASETAQQALDNVEQFTEQLKNAGKISSVGSAINQIRKVFNGKDK